MSNTPRLGIPYILQSQSQKEVTHNDGLNQFDVYIQPLVEDVDLSSAPPSPSEGQVWVVAGGATGDWAGHDGELAQYIGGTWVFHMPNEGFVAWLRDDGVFMRWTGAVWDIGVVAGAVVELDGVQVVGTQQAAIADASSGATQDVEARAALNALLAVCRTHGLIAT